MYKNDLMSKIIWVHNKMHTSFGEGRDEAIKVHFVIHPIIYVFKENKIVMDEKKFLDTVRNSVRTEAIS